MNLDYLEKIKAIISENTGVDADLNVGDFELDEILAELEDAYTIEFGDEKDGMETVADLVTILTDKLE